MFMALIILAAANAVALALGVFAIAEYRSDESLAALLDQMRK